MRLPAAIILTCCALLLSTIGFADPPPLAPVAELSTDLPDRDGDGIPDDAELVIGMDPERADTMHLIYENENAHEQAAELVDGRRRPVVHRVYFGNVAQDRWVWRVDFTHDWLDLGAQVMLYIDADYDAATGRPLGEGGADLRLIAREAAYEVVINNADVVGRDRTARGFVDGNSVYLSLNKVINHTEEGNTLFRVRGLAQMRDGTPGGSSFGWIDVHGPGRQDMPLPPPGNLSQFLSDNALSRERWLGWRDTLAELEAVMLEAEDAQLRGMRRINRALEPQEAGSSASWSSPVAGDYHVNALIQDSAAAREEVTVRVGGEEVARFVAAYDDGDLYLFSTRRPVSLTRGAEIELVADEPAQNHHISEVFLTSAPPAPGKLRIMHLETWVDPDQRGERVDVDVVFVTDRPVRADLEWGAGDALDRRVEGDSTTYNHRITLSGLTRGGTYALQMLAAEGAEEIRSEVLSFTADRLRPERCGVERAQVSLRVGDMMEGARPVWPVFGGIPIARGELSSAQHARLLDAEGNEVAAGFTEIGWWGDGSVRWLLVSVISEGATEYVLEFGASVRAAEVADGIRVEETENSLRITTDVLQATLSRERFSPPGEVIVDLNRDGVFSDDEVMIRDSGEGLVLVDDEGRRFSSAGGPPTRLEVEEQTPVRTVVVAEGPLTGDAGKLMSYRVRMYFYRGFEGIPTVVTLISDEGDSGRPPDLTAFSSFTLPMSLGFEGQADEARWVQEDFDRYATGRDEEREEHEGAGSAITSVADGARSVSVSIRDFAELYPKGFSVEPGAITVKMFPELPSDSYAQYQDDVMLLTRNYYWFRDGAYQIPSGTAPSTDLLLYFGDLGAEEEVAAVDDAWQSFVLLTADPEHYCGTGTFGNIMPQGPGLFDEFDRFARESLDDYERRMEEGRWYSWMNYGDWYGERGVNWGNHEYDLQWGLSLHFVRTGDLRFADHAALAARHSADIDIITSSARPEILGIHKEHALNHTGGYGLPRPEGLTAWFVDGLWNSGHMWSQGNYAAYALTGDRRFGDGAEMVADWIAGVWARSPERWLNRNYGWMTLGVLGSHNVRGNPFHLNAARLFAMGIVSKLDPGTGGPIHPISCPHTPRHIGGKSFMSGIVMAGLDELDRIEPDERYRAALVGIAGWLHAVMYHEETGTFAYNQCSDHLGRRGGAEIRVTRGLARAYELTRDERYREMVERVLVQRILEGRGSGQGKGFAGAIRQPPHALSTLARMGIRELTPSPPQEPEVRLAPETYLTANGPIKLVLNVVYPSIQPLEAVAEIVELPEGVTADPDIISWEIERGATASPPFRLIGKPAPGSTVTVRYTAGEWSGEVVSSFREPRALELGEAIGYVGAPEDPTGQALSVMGVELPLLETLSADTLAGYRGLLVGSEAHEKNFGGLRDHPARLLDFIRAGGRVVIVQIQDSSYRQGYLPYPLMLSNDSGALGKIVAPEHPVFAEPHRIESLEGTVMYDTITEADEAWQVLATDNRGRPAIVEASFGEGAVIVVQPSPCRYLIGAAPPVGDISAQTAARLYENLLAWLAGGE